MKSMWEGGLAQLAMRVVMAEGPDSTLFAQHFSDLRSVSVQKSIYPESPKAAALLRVAQMKLVAATDNSADMTEVVAGMFKEIAAVPEQDLRPVLEAFALGNLLAVEGIVNRIDNWVDVLLRAEQAAEQNAMFATFAVGFQEIAGVEGASGVTLLWNFGIGDVTSVKRLERILDDLSRVDERVRSVWLMPVDESLADYAVWINGAWSTEERSGVLNPKEAAARYGRMASKTRTWNEVTLSLQCSVAEAVLLDEYMEQKEAALAVLAEAEEVAKGHPVVLRGRAGIHYRHREYEDALGVFRQIVGRIDDRNPVEQAFALREAAISAAQCEEWTEAECWFLQAQSAARRVENPDMEVMAAAIGADLAAVALLAGDVGSAICRFSRAVEDSQTMSVQDSLVWAYCQRVVRHAVLWCFNKIEGTDYKGASGESIVFEPGMCSNPNPLKEILEHPLGPIDTVWYMLAQAEATSGVNVGIQDRLKDVLQAGRIPSLDAAIRWRKMRLNIKRLDTDGFATDLLAFLEGEKYLTENRERIAAWNPMEPERGELPTLDIDVVLGAGLQSTARRTIIGYAMRAVCAGELGAIDSLEREMAGTYGERVPGGQILEELKSGESQGSGLEQAVVEIIAFVRRERQRDPEFFWGASFCFFRWSLKSDFNEVLIEGLACWLRAEWTRIVEEEAFQLASPSTTIPRIKEELKSRKNNREFVVRVLLATLPAAVGAGQETYRREVEAMLKE